MNIVLFTHPDSSSSQSMPRFARMLSEGMKARGHQVEVWAPNPKFYNYPAPTSLKKWLGYIDQYILFPAQVRKRLKGLYPNTLFVFSDHALGPWVPLVADRPHVIHCHDFLAQRSAMGTIKENATGWTGKLYQSFIRAGYSKGKHFISVSRRTKEELHEFLPTAPKVSTVVYNGLNPIFIPGNTSEARDRLGKRTGIDLKAGYLLHVGGNQWYKNRMGIIEIYDAWRSRSRRQLPLLMVGAHPSQQLEVKRRSSSYVQDIHFLTGLEDQAILSAYQGASVFLFPSLAEGFGWPIAEAMACGCPVITTADAPMTEVGGDAAVYIARRPSEQDGIGEWAANAAEVVEKTLASSSEAFFQLREKGLANASRFDSNRALDAIMKVYDQVLSFAGATSPSGDQHRNPPSLLQHFSYTSK